ncbi:MAG: glycosyltransferase family 2 protein [Acidobacteriota bacterium]|nr:glycosyltransferase family 2 protein [Acidobacteriota bacterium]
MPAARYSVSVFFPAYNDEASIARMVRDALAVLPSLTDEYEVIVINDGSTDGTGAVLNELAEASPSVRVIHHELNKGYGAALRSGFKSAKKDLVFYTDGDGQYDAREMTALFPLMRDGIDVVNGYKISRSDARHRKVMGAIYNRLARLMFRVPIRDVDCDFRLIRRRALEGVELTSSSGTICVEMISKLRAAGCAFAETPVHHYPREHGASQFFTAPRVARTALDFLRLWLKIAAPRPSAPRKPAQTAGQKNAPVAEKNPTSLE